MSKRLGRELYERAKDNIQVLLEANGYTQRELARLSGLKMSTIAMALCGRNSFNLYSIAGLAKTFGVTPDFILEANLKDIYKTAVRRAYTDYLESKRKDIEKILESEGFSKS